MFKIIHFVLPPIRSPLWFSVANLFFFPALQIIYYSWMSGEANQHSKVDIYSFNCNWTGTYIYNTLHCLTTSGLCVHTLQYRSQVSTGKKNTSYRQCWFCPLTQSSTHDSILHQNHTTQPNKPWHRVACLPFVLCVALSFLAVIVVLYHQQSTVTQLF